MKALLYRYRINTCRFRLAQCLFLFGLLVVGWTAVQTVVNLWQQGLSVPLLYALGVGLVLGQALLWLATWLLPPPYQGVTETKNAR